MINQSLTTKMLGLVWNGKHSKSLRHRNGQVETEDTALSNLTWTCGVRVSWGVAFCKGTSEGWADAGLPSGQQGAETDSS